MRAFSLTVRFFASVCASVFVFVFVFVSVCVCLCRVCLCRVIFTCACTCATSRFKVGSVDQTEAAEEKSGGHHRRYAYPDMAKTQGSFKLDVDAGGFTDSEIIVMLGQNGADPRPPLSLPHPHPSPFPVSPAHPLSIGAAACSACVWTCVMRCTMMFDV